MAQKCRSHVYPGQNSLPREPGNAKRAALRQCKEAGRRWQCKEGDAGRAAKKGIYKKRAALGQCREGDAGRAATRGMQKARAALGQRNEGGSSGAIVKRATQRGRCGGAM